MNNPQRQLGYILVCAFSAAFCEAALKVGLFVQLAAQPPQALGGVALVAGLSVLPLTPVILLAPYTGLLADIFSRLALLRLAKALEFLFCLLCAVFIVRDQALAAVLGVSLLGVSVSFFEPVKFGILPQVVSKAELSRACARLVSLKYFGYILALLVVGGALRWFNNPLGVWCSSVVFASGIGLVAALLIRQPGATGETLSQRELSLRRPFETLRELSKDRQLLAAFAAIIYFIVIGAVLQLDTLLYLRRLLALSSAASSLLLCLAACGIALGGLIAARFSLGKVELGLVPLGAFGLGTSLGLIALCLKNYGALSALYFTAGFFGGLGVVPLFAYFLGHSPSRYCSTYQGLLFSLSGLATLVCAALGLGLQIVFLAHPTFVFVFFSALTFILAGLALWWLPVPAIRCVNWVITNSIFRVAVRGQENLPEQGGALIVCNHVSYLDPLIVAACLERSVRFLVARELFSHWLCGRLLRWIDAIPVSAKDPPRVLLRSLEQARSALRAGKLVCVFAEGEPSRLGHMLEFNRGFERIVSGLDVPIIPAYIDQPYGALIEVHSGRIQIRAPRELPCPATLHFGPALSAKLSSFKVRQAISELGVAAFSARRGEYRYLHLGFLRQAKRHRFKVCLVESSGKVLRYFELLAATLLLRAWLRLRLSDSGTHIGVLLPPSIGACTANLALMFMGRVPVNLNYTVSREALQSAVAQAELRWVLTSRAFVAKVAAPENVELLFLEDFFGKIGTLQRLCYGIVALFCPRWIIESTFARRGAAESEVATVIFSSGSSGAPKGVVLTHANISANVAAVYDVLDITPQDALLAVLPLFHSFGYLTGLWLPLLGGFRALLHFTPLDVERIGELAQAEHATILVGTPSFISSYTRKIAAEKFSSLRLVIAGAEKLKAVVADAFAEKFGVRPLEGYGCTELSPVAMINVPDLRELARAQIGNKPGTVGHPLPGVAVRILEADTLRELPPGELGLIAVRGANVMKGYLNQPELTAEVLRDGWYVTGDLGSIDSSGFVTIHDRLARFSKIGGEMVPHGAIEDALQKIIGGSEQVCVVAAVPDERKGERLVVLCVREFDTREIVRQLAEAGLPNLWIPRSTDFYRITELPLLGSGKLDLQKLKELARNLAKAPGA